MTRFVFDLVPFEKEVTATDGKKSKFTAYGKVINVIRFDNDETKPIQKIQVLEVQDIERYSDDNDSYKSVEPKNGISRIVEYSHHNLPHELSIYLSKIG